jgi:hypothetical protein
MVRLLSFGLWALRRLGGCQRLAHGWRGERALGALGALGVQIVASFGGRVVVCP